MIRFMRIKHFIKDNLPRLYLLLVKIKYAIIKLSRNIKRNKQELYQYLVKTARRFIRYCHRLTSKLELKDVVLFGSIPDYGDSAREVFEYMITTEEFGHYKYVWFCKNPWKQKKLRSLRKSMKGRVVVKRRVDNPLFRLIHLYCESTAKYCFYTHEVVGNFYNEKQVRVYLNHGSFGLKKAVVGNYEQFDCSTYRISVKDWGKGKVSKFRVCGLPRNDRLFDPPEPTRQKLGISGYNKVIIWMPTFKHQRKKSFLRTHRNDYGIEKKYDVSLQEDSYFYDTINRTLSEHNIMLILKYHPEQDLDYVFTKETSNIKIISDEMLREADIPLYSFLGACDAMITDFSSVGFDYLLLNRQIGYDITDLEVLLENSYFRFDSPLKWLPGEHVTNILDLSDFILKVADNNDSHAKRRDKVLNWLHHYKDNQSTKRVVDMLLKQD